jgi:hypothetical protein
VWNSSFLSARCEAGEFQGAYIIGDSAYACRSYLMTPLLNPKFKDKVGKYIDHHCSNCSSP